MFLPALPEYEEKKAQNGLLQRIARPRQPLPIGFATPKP